MSRFAYVNGRFVRHGQAAVHIEDRGYQLADGVYEVWAVFDGKLADAEGHFARLWRPRISRMAIPRHRIPRYPTSRLDQTQRVVHRSSASPSPTSPMPSEINLRREGARCD
jgi:branched-subunit amino acid aminotransferase/4-amino-4-deoxychorismate lyase